MAMIMMASNNNVSGATANAMAMTSAPQQQNNGHTPNDPPKHHAPILLKHAAIANHRPNPTSAINSVKMMANSRKKGIGNGGTKVLAEADDDGHSSNDASNNGARSPVSKMGGGGANCHRAAILNAAIAGWIKIIIVIAMRQCGSANSIRLNYDLRNQDANESVITVNHNDVARRKNVE
eukprot:CAMPEP_0201989752 /NCGR_PEP_ID=MMETSP0904-20121228/93019_1 /ASSEMBLY_ACC=CAM_ASM_000553 /TAXON_ID=420261 /ORGANISM="Thalassiosira antarctica, Strain CCMP982" /LENGTH=178 /DNA_ID=CAMNT_0048543991 /DNA_START=463 /DNA_END=1002 /DNA_ORIENTATION=-